MRWSGSASSRASPTCSRGTPPTTSSPRSTSSAVRDGANLEVAGYEFAPSFSIWTTIEECLNPPVIWEKGPRLVHHAAVQRAGGLRLPRGHRPGRVRQRRARGSAADAAVGGLQASHLQVRPRQRVHRGAQDAAQARARQDRQGQGRRRRGQPARRGRRVPARPGDPRRQDDAARPAPVSTSRAPARTASRGRRTSTTWSTTSGRCRSTATSAWSGRPRSTRSSRSSCSPPACGTGTGVLGPEAFDAVPFLDLLTAYGSPWGQREDVEA